MPLKLLLLDYEKEIRLGGFMSSLNSLEYYLSTSALLLFFDGVLVYEKLSEFSKTSPKSFTYLREDLVTSESQSLYSYLEFEFEIRTFLPDF